MHLRDVFTVDIADLVAFHRCQVIQTIVRYATSNETSQWNLEEWIKSPSSVTKIISFRSRCWGRLFILCNRRAAIQVDPSMRWISDWNIGLCCRQRYQVWIWASVSEKHHISRIYGWNCFSSYCRVVTCDAMFLTTSKHWWAKEKSTSHRLPDWNLDEYPDRTSHHERYCFCVETVWRSFFDSKTIEHHYSYCWSSDPGVVRISLLARKEWYSILARYGRWAVSQAREWAFEWPVHTRKRTFNLSRTRLSFDRWTLTCREKDFWWKWFGTWISERRNSHKIFARSIDVLKG